MLFYPSPLPIGPRALAVGNFDGVHAGHRHLLAAARAQADLRGLPLWVLTFDPHPRQLLRPETPLKLLMNLNEKYAALRAQGVDEVAVLPFTAEVALWEPAVFIHDILDAWLQAQMVVVGDHFRFGHKAAGDVDFMRRHGTFETYVVPLLRDEYGVVSSTRLRAGPQA